MKNFKFQLFAVFLGLSILSSCKKENVDQFVTKTVDFEDLSIGDIGYWNGSDGSGSFVSSGMTFSNNYNTMYFSWEGFAYSQKADVTTSGFDNQYSVFDSSNGVNKFGIYYPPFAGDLYASFPAGAQNTIKSMDLCNSTYVALSMKNGDSFAKKFGGTSGNDKDWFKMTIIGYNAVGDSVKAIDFYLADYRSDDNSKDYIINKWTTVDLTSLGKINKVAFRFSSSDNGSFGMNTPAIVCLDNLKYEVVRLEN
jgi:hypothetical protein